MIEILDVLIIGAGPAGLGAAVYAIRAGLSCLCIEKSGVAGGQIINTASVDNYLGLKGIEGFAMGNAFKEHATEMGAEIVTDDIISIAEEKREGETIKVVKGKENTYYTKTVICAMGAAHAHLGVDGELDFTGRGVSYCATCDGFFFRKKEVIVVGGGEVAVSDALVLSEICSKVTLIHRRDTLRAAKTLVDKLMAKENVEIIWNSSVTKIEGTDAVNSVTVKNLIRGTEKLYETSGVFVAIGMKPQTVGIDGLPNLDESGYIVAGEDLVTNIPGIFAAGDVRTKALRQVITAVSDGANAINSVQKYIFSNYK